MMRLSRDYSDTRIFLLAICSLCHLFLKEKGSMKIAWRGRGENRTSTCLLLSLAFSGFMCISHVPSAVTGGSLSGRGSVSQELCQLVPR